MRQLDMIEPELPLDGGSEPQASRWARRDAAALAGQAARLAERDARRGTIPATLVLTPPPSPIAPPPAAETSPSLLNLMHDRSA